MGNLLNYAKTEFEVLLKTKTEELIIEPFIPEVLALIEAFGRSGQSGGSAPYTGAVIIDTLKKLLKYEPLLPITGIDEEWVDVAEYNEGKPLYQNKRCGPVFKEDKNGKPYYLDAIVFKEGKDNYFTGSAFLENGNKIYSHQYCTLPFIPKSFYIDVVKKEIGKDDFEWQIKDEKQLSKVFKYYLKKTDDVNAPL